MFSRPSLQACKRGNTDVVRLLVENGADCNILSKHKNTAMYFAKLSNNLMVCDLIKDHISMWVISTASSLTPHWWWGKDGLQLDLRDSVCLLNPAAEVLKTWYCVLHLKGFIPFSCIRLSVSQAVQCGGRHHPSILWVSSGAARTCLPSCLPQALWRTRLLYGVWIQDTATARG